MDERLSQQSIEAIEQAERMRFRFHCMPLANGVRHDLDPSSRGVILAGYVR